MIRVALNEWDKADWYEPVLGESLKLMKNHIEISSNVLAIVDAQRA